MSVNQKKTIKLNVGGSPYNVPLELINRFPDSKLAKTISERKEGNHSIDFGGNGKMFEYVLAYMRHSFVELPQGESKAIFVKELEYFDIEVDVASISSYCQDNLERSLLEHARKTAVAGLNYICGKTALDIRLKALKIQLKETLKRPATSKRSNIRQKFSISYKKKHIIDYFEDLNVHDEEVKKEFIKTINAIAILKASKIVVTHVNMKKTLGGGKVKEIVVHIDSAHYGKKKVEHEEKEYAESLDNSTDVEEEVDNTNYDTTSSLDSTRSSLNDSTSINWGTTVDKKDACI
ncbi:hypothetical protein CTEN210_11925 [Chaetoceros tenuissimus]|uniref:Potassium channel tetramerisation-type BTB domain-containing protein n=1 Tax=Chaetoceros tenuissimus TaxID=426638 RepID=A0AAD3D0K1_9STRA|nr:hypothetical protein CTEN210_11925 [Chaetoceros tenuissimus]